MFQVKNKETGQEYYEDGHWKWQTIDDFVPVIVD